MKRSEFLKILPAAAAATSALAQGGKKKPLVVYYSWSGNTRSVAEFIREFTNADILEVLPSEPYPASYRSTVEIAKKENAAEFKRPIKTKIEKLADYDAVFVGSPNWWGTISGPIRTLLCGHDFSSKKIIPFMTHEGSRFGYSLSEIKKICPKAELLQGFETRGGSAKNSADSIKKWLSTLSI